MNRDKRLDLDDLQQMYRAGTARLARATNMHPGVCYVCQRHFPPGEGRIWKLQGSVRGTRVICIPCDTAARTRAGAAAERGGE